MRSSLTIYEELAQALQNQHFLNNKIKVSRVQNDQILLNINQKIVKNIHLKHKIQQIKKKIPQNIIKQWKSTGGLQSKLTSMRNLKNLLIIQCEKVNAQLKQKRRQEQTLSIEREQQEAQFKQKYQILRQREDQLYKLRQKNQIQEQQLQQLLQFKNQMRESINKIISFSKQSYSNISPQSFESQDIQNIIENKQQNKHQSLVNIFTHFSVRKTHLEEHLKEISQLHTKLNKEIQTYEEQKRERGLRKDQLIKKYQKKQIYQNSINQLTQKIDQLLQKQKQLIEDQVQKRIQQRCAKQIRSQRRYGDIERQALKIVIKSTMNSKIENVQKLLMKQDL